jgi:aladin
VNGVGEGDDVYHLYMTDMIFYDECTFILILFILEWKLPECSFEYQKNIECMEWRPYSGHQLAVGCDNGIILWNMDLKSMSTYDSTLNEKVYFKYHYGTCSWVECFLTFPHHRPICDLSWSSCGRYLASCSFKDSALLIWDMIYQIGTPLRRIERSMYLCKWSPKGNYLFSSSLSCILRVWETTHFSSERWSGSDYCHVSNDDVP